MQAARCIVQAGFLTLTIAAVFLFGANAERWCPFGGVEAFWTYFREGNLICSLATSNFFILGGVIASVVLLRRAFCGYICPIGTISEWLHRLAGRLGLRRFRVVGLPDRALALLKYVLLAVIVATTWTAGELVFRGYDPCYALIGRHGEDITVWAYIVSGAIVAASLLVAVPFCRWVCPLAAVLNPFSHFALTRIRRERSSCTACDACTRACPAAIPVATVDEVTEARCIACFSCIDACPRKDQDALTWGPPKSLGCKWPRLVLVAVLFACVSAAVGLSALNPIASFIKQRGDAPANVAAVDLKVANLSCRGRANLLVGFLERDDAYAMRGPSADAPGYYKLEAWPGPGFAAVRVIYDPSLTDAATVRKAITEPYYDAGNDKWWNSPFEIEGYDPLAE